MSEYHLASKLERYSNAIVLVGCGGTGGWVAEGLARLLLTYPQVDLVLIDDDLVEERNLMRQNFYPEDLGKPKAQALAERLARKYRRRVAYSNTAIGLNRKHSPLQNCFLIVGCVDNAQARAAIARTVSPTMWWLDAGNGREFGQVLVGNATAEQLRGSFDPSTGVCSALPLPTMVRPELLVPTYEEGSCSISTQGQTINQFMSALVVEMIRRLLEGRLTWWQVFLDLESGTLHTVSPTPEAVSKLIGIPLRNIERR